MSENEQSGQHLTPIEELMFRVLSRLKHTEVTAFNWALQRWMKPRMEELAVLERQMPGLGGRILEGFASAFESEEIQRRLAQQRLRGNSTGWLFEEITKSLDESFDLLKKRIDRAN